MKDDNLVERLREHVARRPDKVALRFLEQDGVAEELTFAELDERIRSVAARLQQLGGAGERAVILLPSGINYVVAFYACLYSGVIAVPAYPPEESSARYAGRLNGILRDAAPRFILVESGLCSLVEAAFPELTNVQIIAVDSLLTEPAADWRETKLATDAVAFLQYTSGSTSQPKGVCVSHGNLVANERAIEAAAGGTLDDVFVSWLPLYHDMGLIGGLLNPLFTGFTGVLMSPRNFLERPRRWLEAIDRHGGTLSGGPDFAFALCTDRISDEIIDRLDLSRWRFAFSGSEFVRHTTVRRFCDRFARAGFNRHALNACYGLAEATLLVTASDGTAETISYTLDTAKLATGVVACASKGTDLVACGRPPADHATRIMRVDGSAAAEMDEVGEIWVTGPSVTLGYWNNPDATRQVFVERDGARWLRTGDLGFIRDGALVVAGRLKDVLIVRGQNIYPTDVEQAVEADVESVRRGRVAAFAVEADGQEGIGVAAEFSRAVLKGEDPEVLAEAIGQAVLRQAQEYPAVIVLLNPRAMPLTTSGKLQRSACAARLASNTLDSFMVFERGRRRDGAPLTAPVTDTERAVSLIWCDALDLKAVHCEDDFFVLGGNSLKAGQVASAIRERFGVELELRSFFDAPTLAGFAKHIESLAQNRFRPSPSIPKAASADRTTLSHAQERLWFLWNMDPAGTAYTVASTIRLNGKLDHAALRGAIDQIVCRHEALRTTFVAIEGRATQVIHDAMNVDNRHEDLRAYPANIRDARAAAIRRSELARPFDLVNGPLFRAILLQLADDTHELLLLAHHIVVDGWSLDVLLQELSGLYRSALGEEVDLPPVPAVQYADFAIWQRNWLAEGEGDRQLEYWRTKLGDVHPLLALPHDRPRPMTQSHGGDTVGLAIDGMLAARLRKIAAENRASVFMLMLAAYQLLLYRYCGQNDLRIGVPVAGRQQAELERLIGCFVNTLVLRAEIVDDTSFTSLLRQVKETVIQALSHQDLPFEMLVDSLRPERNGGHNPLFQAKFNYMTAPRGFNGVDGLSADIEIMDLAGSHFDLALDVVDSPFGMKATFNYATDLFDRPTIERFTVQFGSMLRQIVDDVERRISDFVIDDANRQVLASQPTTFEFDDVVRLHRASTSGEDAAVAVRCGDETLTFADLEKKSNRVANMLIARGVTREVAVALWIERSPAFVVTLLGVLKAGAAYVPLDPKWPLERVRRILNEGHIEILLAAADKLTESHVLDCVVIDANAETTNQAISDSPPETVIHPAQTAYVIYTSGSTGTPKGVAVPHGALANYVQAFLQRLQPQSSASMAMVSTVAADLGHTVLFGALASGTTLNLLSPEAVLDPDAFAQAVGEEKVGVLKIVPSHLRGLLQARRSADLLPCETLVLGGEACDAMLLDEVRRLRPHCRIINHYGPTETTVGVVTHECVSVHKNEPVPIGLPLANLRVHVLDNSLNEVPIGVTGELYIGGAGVARGYRGAAGLTAEQFVPDPFGRAGDRLYRTGDRVRCDRAGRLIFIGRSDDQIKLRGYRVEPDEVGRALKALPGINDAVVIARSIDGQAGRQELVAYCVPGDGVTLEAEAVKRQLSAIVPDYMVPSHMIVLERLPLTSNGKIDRKALPETAGSAVLSTYAEPAGDTEATIAEVWREVLGRERVGRNDNFFELGGDSILSLQIVARLRKRGVRVTPKQIFGQQTIASLAAVAVVTTDSVAGKEKHGSRIGNDPATSMRHLLPIQNRFFSAKIGNRNHWNQAVLLIPQARMNWDVLRRALTAVAEHHDALRLRFKQVHGGWRAEKDISPAPSDLLWTHAGVGDAKQVTALASAAQKSLSLSSGPLLRAVGMDLADGSQRLLLAIHHLVVDGVSWRILLEDLASAYEQLEKGDALELAPKSDSYASWSERLHAYAASAELASELSLWLDCEAGSALPCDDNHGVVDLVGDTEEVSLVLDPDLTSSLLEEAPAAYRTRVNDLMLAGLARAVSRWSGCEDVTVELEGHGREDIFSGADVSRTVGWFTTAFPVRLQGGGDDASLIKAVKEKLRAIPNHGLGYGVLRYLGSDEQRRVLERVAEPRIVFNYLGRFDSSVGESSRFSFAPESPGPSRCASGPMRGWLTINGLVRDGRLRLSFEYGRKRYRRATIERLTRLYETALRELAAHCCSGVSGLTPSDVALSGLRQVDLDQLGVALDARNIQDIYPLSPMQQGMLFHALRDGGNDAYVNQVGIELLGFDAGKLRMAWQAVSDRHAALRTGFMWRSLAGAAQQVVYRHAAVPFIEEDWRQRAVGLERGDKRAELDAALAEVSRQEREKGFDLAQAPLQRVRLIHLDDKRHWLIWTHHHILADGWSSARLVAEVLQHVRDGVLPAAQGSYRDYIAWLQGRDSASAERFWRGALAELETPTLLANAVVTNKASDDLGHASTVLAVNAELTWSLKSLAKRERVTLNTVIQAAWAQLLRRLSGQFAVCFGVTVSGRPEELPGAEETVGLFINTLPIVDAPSPQTQVGDWLRRLQEQNLVLREHGWTPLYEIQRFAGRGGQTLFDSILVFENYPIEEDLLQAGESGPRLGRVDHVTPTNFALAVAVFAGNDRLNLEFNYDRAQFDGATIQRLRDMLLGLLEQIAFDAGGSLGRLGSAAGYETMVLNWSGAAQPPPPASSIGVVAHIEAQAAQACSSVAVIWRDRHLSYGELNSRANQLARWLHAQDIGPDCLVGIALARSPETMVALLAVLKAGAAYLPLDPDYPAERLVHMLRDSGARLVLTESEQLKSLSPVLDEIAVETLCIDRPSLFAGEDTGNLNIEIHPDSLAYVIYTSGSTGTPKGVAVAHGPLAMHCEAISRLYRMTPRDREFQTASINFDIAHERWLAPLMAGGSLVLPSRPGLLIDDLVYEIERSSVTTIFLPPAYADQLSAALRQSGRKLSIRACIVGGEAWSETGIKAVRETVDADLLINAYGPTETVIAPTAWVVDEATLQPGQTAPIGRPVGARTAYILDADLNVVPAGVTGELFIGGAGLARGYLNRSAMTAERFIPDPFGANGDRLYRTGDLARWRDDGVIDYVGRADQQVKIRGFRIELGEIEACLIEQRGVRAAAVVAQDSKTGRHLVAYASGDPTLDGAALRDALAAVLPDYMVPATIVVLEQLPLSRNGKIDRKALPKPHEGMLACRRYEAPEDDVEIALARMWSEILDVERIGRNDHFFELGGHSLLAVRVLSLVSQEFGVSIPISDLFAHPELAAFARVVSIRLIEQEFDAEELRELIAVEQ